MSSRLRFVITLIFGIFGVHKFIDRQIGMGILYFFTLGLFGIGWISDTVKAGKIAFSNAPCNSSQNISIPLTALPVVPSSGLLLKEDEFCCLKSAAQNLTIKNVVTGYRNKSAGMNVHIAKGVNIHTGGGKAAPVRGNISQKTNGTFYITNKRVIMVCPKGAFDKPLGSITAIQGGKDGVQIQFGNQNYTILLPNSSYVCAIIEAALNGLPAEQII